MSLARLNANIFGFMSPNELNTFMYNDDEDLKEFFRNELLRVPRRIRLQTDRLNKCNAAEFLKLYRVSKETALKLFTDIENAITPNTMRNKAVEPLNKLLATLRFYATAAYKSTVAELGGISETSERDIIAQTTIAIAKLRPKYVTFPQTWDSVKRKFYKIAKFPNVLMAIGCSHVKITSPGGVEAEVFRNRKGYFSLIIQTACDSESRVFDCVARWPGSTHNQRIFDNSRLKYRLDNSQFGTGFVIGDSGYKNQKYLLTPLSHPNTPAEHLYNESIIKTGNTVERTYDVLRRRFPILTLGINCSVELAMPVILAIMVLHNLALEDPLPAAEGSINLEKCNDAKIIVKRYSVGDNTMQKDMIYYFDTMIHSQYL